MQEQRGMGETSLRDLVTVVLRRKWIILILVFSSSAYAGWKAFNTPVMYRSAGQILIRSGERSSALVSNLEFRPWEEVINSEIAIISSQPIAERATQILRQEYEAKGIPGKPPPIWRSGIKSDAKRNSNIIDISYMHPEPQTARRCVDAILEAYSAVHKDLFRLPDAHQMFNQEVMRAQREIELLERSRKEYAQKMRISSLDRQKQTVLNLLSTLRVQHNTLVQEIGSKRAEIRQTERMLREEHPSQVPFAYQYGPAGQQAFTEARRELVALETERRKLLARYTENHPQVAVLDRQIQEMEADLADIAEGILKIQRSELEVLELELGTVREQMASLEEELVVYPEQEMVMLQYDRSLGLVTNAFRELLVKEMHMKVSEVSARDYEVVILSRASKPEATNPRDPVRLSLAPALSLFLGIGLAFFLDRLDHSLKTREDVENYLGLPVLTSIPDVRIRKPL